MENKEKSSSVLKLVPYIIVAFLVWLVFIPVVKHKEFTKEKLVLHVTHRARWYLPFYWLCALVMFFPITYSDGIKQFFEEVKDDFGVTANSYSCDFEFKDGLSPITKHILLFISLNNI